MSQPVLGAVATAIVLVVSLGFLSLFDFPTFAGWVAFYMLCLIPAQIVLVVLAPNAVAPRLGQPARGLVLLALTAVIAAVATPIALQLAGEGIGPPGPIPSHYVVIVVPTTFFLAIIFGGWPFSAMTRNSGVIAALVLVASYAITYGIFRTVFNYDFLQGTPVYLASAPSGITNGVFALVSYVTVLAGMFLVLHFDLWPLTTMPGIMKQPILGIVWMIIAFAIGMGVMQVAVGMLGRDPMWVLTRVTAPFIFGTIVVLNMLQNSLFAKLAQPLKGVANAVTAAILGVALAQVYGMLSPSIVGALPSGAPGFEYEIWLVNALLSVTFPFLIFYAAYFHYWPLAKQAASPAEPART